MQSNPELSLKDKKYLESRKNPRLDVDLETSIEFRLQNDDYQKLHEAFIIDISAGGCGIKTINQDAKPIRENTICYISDPETRHILTKTRIVWVQETTNNAFRIGLEYID
ncbi:PilZ domain-containing protein [Xenococcus sp. PCC 7305]|uniref:PilZ domain-containing protein n=1 Tax=Xenococcus sp. PCC 7305 TaxID=102125 RepID=UPI0002AC3F3F|nr:PilZ domain-containing protein [Xenococcus sp. PCC 7305]ELS03677.1 PilZ domain-containing protein [Xenococcus sp. PCC 7305]